MWTRLECKSTKQLLSVCCFCYMFSQTVQKACTGNYTGRKCWYKYCSDNFVSLFVHSSLLLHFWYYCMACFCFNLVYIHATQMLFAFFPGMKWNVYISQAPVRNNSKLNYRNDRILSCHFPEKLTRPQSQRRTTLRHIQFYHFQI